MSRIALILMRANAKVPPIKRRHEAQDTTPLRDATRLRLLEAGMDWSNLPDWMRRVKMEKQ